MTEATRPQRIFMASDLSARCDRALARAALLARAWHSELTVAHVVHAAEVAAHDRLSNGAPSWRRPESWSQTLERAPRADLATEGRRDVKGRDRLDGRRAALPLRPDRTDGSGWP